MKGLRKKRSCQFVIKDIDKKQQILFGLASRVADKDGDLVVDTDDMVLDAKALEGSVYNYVLFSGKMGVEHKDMGEGKIVESFFITPEKKKLLGMKGGEQVAWWIGFKVFKNELWKKVEEGEYPHLSIAFWYNPSESKEIAVAA